MWGIFRTFETRQDGEDSPLLADQEFPYTGRRIGRYPDGTRIERLLPLPDRAAPPLPTEEHPGYPLHIPGEVHQKSPVPPWPDREFTEEELTEPEHAPPPYVTSLLAEDMPLDFDYRPVPTDLERLAFNERPVPGELFTRNPLNKQQAEIYDTEAESDPDLQRDHETFLRNDFREVAHDVTVARVTVVRDGESIDPDEQRIEHMVLVMQDGLRLFLNGNTGFPLGDPPEEPPEEGEKEDQGQKGFNYRTEPIGPVFDPEGSEFTLANPDPATPVWRVPVGKKVRFHLVGGCDKPRNYSFTIHGVTWPEHRFLSDQRMVSSESAISCGTVRTFEFTPEHVGDHAYRSGMLRWAVAQGMWGLLRVEEVG